MDMQVGADGRQHALGVQLGGMVLGGKDVGDALAGGDDERR
jgi:hypothetical protein